jgi:hypothetical protein
MQEGLRTYLRDNGEGGVAGEPVPPPKKPRKNKVGQILNASWANRWGKYIEKQEKCKTIVQNPICNFKAFFRLVGQNAKTSDTFLSAPLNFSLPHDDFI